MLGIWMYMIYDGFLSHGGTPKSSKTRQWLSIESSGDSGIPLKDSSNGENWMVGPGFCWCDYVHMDGDIWKWGCCRWNSQKTLGKTVKLPSNFRTMLSDSQALYFHGWPRGANCVGLFSAAMSPKLGFVNKNLQVCWWLVELVSPIKVVIIWGKKSTNAQTSQYCLLGKVA